MVTAGGIGANEHSTWGLGLATTLILKEYRYPKLPCRMALAKESTAKYDPKSTRPGRNIFRKRKRADDTMSFWYGYLVWLHIFENRKLYKMLSCNKQMIAMHCVEAKKMEIEVRCPILLEEPTP